MSLRPAMMSAKSIKNAGAAILLGDAVVACPAGNRSPGLLHTLNALLAAQHHSSRI